MVLFEGTDVPRQVWKNKEVKAGLPVKTDKEMKVLAANIEEAIGEGKASKHDLATWLIHWFLTQDFKAQFKIVEKGKAIEESLRPQSNPHTAGGSVPSGSRRGATRVWTNRIKDSRGDGPDRLDGDRPTVGEVSYTPVGK